MKKQIMASLFIFMMLVLYTAPASVQAMRQATITPSPTFIPPSITPTPYLFTCPVGTPLGWGIYTPSPLWLSTCGSCGSIPTNTVAPTFTPNPLDGTATITPTATVTVTPSPAPSVTPTLYGGSRIRMPSWYTSTKDNDFTCDPDPFIYTYEIHCQTTTDDEDDHNIVDEYTGNDIPISVEEIPATWYYTFQVSGLSAPNYIDLYISGIHQGIMGNGVHTGSWTASTTGNNPFAWIVRSSTDGSYTGPVYAVVDVVISSSPYVPPTPTPTATPSTYIPTYCSSVAPTYAEFGFDLFQPDGEPNCSIGWDETTVGDYTLPAVQICLQPSKFGVIRLFNKDFEVGIYGLAAAAAFFYRFFRTA